jgi:hypothetical protein
MGVEDAKYAEVVSESDVKTEAGGYQTSSLVYCAEDWLTTVLHKDF